MLRVALVFALAIGALASSCYVEEDYLCVRKDYVSCGGDVCHGYCSVDYKKSCDRKVDYETVCEVDNYCKEIETPCGHGGSDPYGLYCGYDEECIVEPECKLIPAGKKKSFAGWKFTPKSKGFFEVCKDVHTCAPIDPWALDYDRIDVVCKKEYTIVDDMDCDSLFHHKSLWGGRSISKSEFFKMNHGFSCGEKLIGRVVCLEADAFIKGYTCKDGTVCEKGYECATRETCKQVPVSTPVCDRVPFYTCLADGGGSELCGNHVCSYGEKCEVITNTVCPTVPHLPIDPVIIDPVDPVVPVIPSRGGGGSAVASSTSISDELGTSTDAFAKSAGNADAVAAALATRGDELTSDSFAESNKDGAVADTFTEKRPGSYGTAEATADAERINKRRVKLG